MAGDAVGEPCKEEEHKQMPHRWAAMGHNVHNSKVRERMLSLDIMDFENQKLSCSRSDMGDRTKDTESHTLYQLCRIGPVLHILLESTDLYWGEGKKEKNILAPLIHQTQSLLFCKLVYCEWLGQIQDSARWWSKFQAVYLVLFRYQGRGSYLGS